MIDICVIGYGYWGPNLCRNFSNLTGYNLTAICDINNQNLSIAKKNYPNVKTYKNFKEAINENNFQLIVLATPTSTHYSLAKFILKKSINLLVEKPLCLSIKHHLNLNKIAKKNKVKIFIDYPFIFSGSMKYVKSIIDKIGILCFTEESVQNAIETISKKEQNCLILITGSLYLAGEVLNLN